MNEGTCTHYTGLLNPGNPREARCKAGVCYWELCDGDRPGIMLRLPCVQFRVLPAHGRGTHVKPGEPTVRVEVDRKGNEAIPCDRLQLPSLEDVERDRAETDAAWLKTIEAIKLASAWRVKGRPEQGRHEVVECPICHGALHLSQSAYNGHVRGNCETEGCVSWME